MTTQKLYNLYLTKKAEVAILQNQMQTIGQQLYQAETEFNNVSEQINIAGNLVLIQSLGLGE